MDDEKEQKDEETKSHPCQQTKKLVLTMDTNLGNSKKEFYENDLMKLEYFANQLSGRWCNDSIINISSEQLNFDVNEVEILIQIKKANKIPLTYPFKRLLFLGNALDYFTEKMDSDIIGTYVAEYIPAIQQKQLIWLQSSCAAKQCSVLSKAFGNYMKKSANEATEFDKQIIYNWKNVPSELLIRNAYVAASIFHSQFKITLVRTFHSQDNYVIDLVNKRNVKDLKMIWAFIIANKLWRYYPQIITSAICNMKGVKKMYQIKMQNKFIFVETMTNIVVDTMEIIFGQQNLSSGIQSCNVQDIIGNFFDILTQMNSNSTKCCRFIFIKEVFCKLLDLKTKQGDTFNCYGANGKVIELLANNFALISKEAEEIKFTTDIVQVINGKFKQDIKILCDIFKPLFEMDVIEASKFTKIWFPICMKRHKNWIMDELPNKVSRNAIKQVIKAICDYMLSAQNKKCPCPSEYVAFVNQYI